MSARDSSPAPAGVFNSPNTGSSVDISEEVHKPVDDVHDGDSEWKPTTRLYLAFLALCTLTLMVALDGTSLSVALPIIASKLRGSALEAFWTGTGFLLASTVFQPNFASFSHIFGRVPVVMTAITLFFIGVMVAAFANNFTVLLVGRCIQGVGGGGIIAMTEVIITDLVPMRYRGQWAGIIGAMWAVGSVTGPVIGGVFSQKVSWRWLFYINLPFIGIGYVLIPLFLRLNVLPGSLVAKLRRVDWAGSTLFVASTTSFLIPLTWGGVMYDWSSWHTVVPLVVGAVGLVGFCFYEVYVAKEPVIRLSIFANRTVNIAYVTTVFHGIILWCLLYYQPLYYEGVRGFSPTLSGVAMFPATFTVAPMGVVTGIAITATGKYRWTVWLGWVIATVGLGILPLLEPDTPTVKWIFLTLISGIGLGMLFPSLQIQVQAASSAKNMAFAVAMFSFFRAFGQTLGVAIGGVIFQNRMIKELAQYPQFAPIAGELAKNAAALVEVIKTTSNEADKLALRVAYTDSLRVIYYVICGFSGLALILSLFIKDYELSTQLDTDQGLVAEKKEQDTESGSEK